MEREELEQCVLELSRCLDENAPSLSAEDIDRGLDVLEKVDKYLTDSVFGDDLMSISEHNIAIVGTTGAGKSTVASLLFGKGKTVVHHQSKYARVLVAEPPLPGSAIRSGGTSVTLLPVVNYVYLSDYMVALWDMPGSRDTRGPFAELLVHFIYHWMLKDGSDVRFIIVSPPLHERPQQMMLENLINSSLVHADNAVVVYTKCSEDFDPDSTSDLELHESKKNIRSFALPAPTSADKEGCNYSLRYLDRKLAILQTLGELQLHSVKYEQHLPPAAELLLDRFCESSIAFARDVLSVCFLRVYDWDSYVGTLAEIDDTLLALRDSTEMSFEAAMEILTHLIPYKGDNIRQDAGVVRAGKRLSLVGTIVGDKIHRHLADWLNADCIRTIEEAKERLVQLRNTVINYSYHEAGCARINNTFVLVVSAFHLRLSKELARVHKLLEKHRATIASADTIPVVVIVGFSSLEVDTNMKMWTNVALVSPSIKVTADESFDLSARGQAKSAPRYNRTAGTPGQHGESGLPGGNLFVVGETLDDPRDLLLATSSCGQQGGDGQNGGDGVNGEDSRYCSNDFKSAIQRAMPDDLPENGDDEKALLDELQVGSYQDLISPLSGKFYGTQGVRSLTVTKASVSGGKGLQPGRGGTHGAGGRGGYIRLQIGNSLKEKTGETGLSGNDGIHGKQSRDGRPSPSFSAVVCQWYFKGGWWYDGTKAKPQIDDVKVTDADIPPMMYADPVQTPPESNNYNAVAKSCDLNLIQEKYDMVFTRLKSKFPQCNFKNLKVEVETECDLD